jgi:hypothetical protein
MEILMLIQKITSLSVYMNNTTEHTVCIHFLGHINIFRIKFFYGGLKEFEDATFSYDVNLSRSNAENKLTNILEELSELYMKEVRKIVQNI